MTVMVDEFDLPIEIDPVHYQVDHPKGVRALADQVMAAGGLDKNDVALIESRDGVRFRCRLYHSPRRVHRGRVRGRWVEVTLP